MPKKYRTIGVLLCLGIYLTISAAAGAEVIFDWVTIGDPGAPAGPTGRGVVDYSYRISKYEVTNSQFNEFLNAVIDDDTLYDPRMSANANGGILRFGDGTAENPFHYDVKPGFENKPVVFVSAFSVMTFVNWLEFGQPKGIGRVALLTDPDAVYNTSQAQASAKRRPGASYVIPNLNEWYKAAAYDPVTQTHYRYATSSNDLPLSAPPPGSAAPVPSNTANIFLDDGLDNAINNGHAVTGSTVREDDQVYLTDVGSYPLSPSPYGTFDQTGNVQEWTEFLVSRNWGLIGGSWVENEPFLTEPRFIVLTQFQGQSGTFRTSDLGFRVANLVVPEPSTTLLGKSAVLFACWFMAIRRRK